MSIATPERITPLTRTAPGSLRWEFNAFLGFFERQKNLYRRYWLWELVWFAYSVVSVLSIGYLASGLTATGVKVSAAAVNTEQLYLLVGSLLWSYLSLVFFEVSFAVTWERWEGTIEYTMMAPVRRVTHLLGVTCFAIIYGLIRTALVLVAIAFAFHLNLSHADMLGAVTVLLAATVPLIGLGIFTAILPLLSPEKGEQMSVAIQGILLLVSGVYYPVSVLPLVFRVIGVASPLTYTLSSIRQSVLDGVGIAGQLPTIGLLLAMGAVLMTTGLLAFSWAERRAKRLGLLKRSG